MYYLELVQKVEQITRDVVTQAFPTSWEEDFISLSLLQALRRSLARIQVRAAYSATSIKSQIFKAKGKLENKFGDIAVIVRNEFANGDIVEGVGFLEAKKRHRKSGKFDEIDLAQFKRITGNAPSARSLLYDFDPITGFATSSWDLHWTDIHRIAYMFLPATNAVCVPLSIHLARKIDDTGLYSSSIPFSQQLLGRFLNLLDMEFATELLNLAKGRASDLGVPAIILAVSIQKGEPQEVNFEIDERIFQRFE